MYRSQKVRADYKRKKTTTRASNKLYEYNIVSEKIINGESVTVQQIPNRCTGLQLGCLTV